MKSNLSEEIGAFVGGPQTPVSGHTPGEDWSMQGTWVVREYPGIAIRGMAVEPICDVRDKRHRELIASAPRLARENAALRAALNGVLSAYRDCRLVAHGMDWNETNPIIESALALVGKETSK